MFDVDDIVADLEVAEVGKEGGDLRFLAAGAAGDLLRRNQRFLRFQRRVASCSFIGLGVTAALASRK